MSLSVPLSVSGSSDRRSKHVQRHPEEPGRVQTARRSAAGSAAPAAGAVVLQPAPCGRLSAGAGRLVASQPASQPAAAPRTDKHTFV